MSAMWCNIAPMRFILSLTISLHPTNIQPPNIIIWACMYLRDEGLYGRLMIKFCMKGLCNYSFWKCVITVVCRSSITMPRRVLSRSFLQRSLRKRSQQRFRKFCLHEKDNCSSYTWKAMLKYFLCNPVHYWVGFHPFPIAFFFDYSGCWAVSGYELCEDNVVTLLK